MFFICVYIYIYIYIHAASQPPGSVRRCPWSLGPSAEEPGCGVRRHSQLD